VPAGSSVLLDANALVGSAARATATKHAVSAETQR
jgi:hypothetical protein